MVGWVGWSKKHSVCLIRDSGEVEWTSGRVDVQRTRQKLNRNINNRKVFESAILGSARQPCPLKVWRRKW